MEQMYYFVERSCWLWLGRRLEMVEMGDMDMVCRLGFAKHCVTF